PESRRVGRDHEEREHAPGDERPVAQNLRRPGQPSLPIALQGPCRIHDHRVMSARRGGTLPTAYRIGVAPAKVRCSQGMTGRRPSPAGSPARSRRPRPRPAPLEGPIDLSVVVPLHDEEANLAALLQTLRDALTELGRSYEIILVDDGSTDGTRRGIEEIAE